MTLKQYEKKLKEVNPDFSIRKYRGIAGIFLNKKYLIRLELGELQPLSLNAEFVQPNGQRYEKMLRRGRISAARILYAKGWIRQRDVAHLS